MLPDAVCLCVRADTKKDFEKTFVKGKAKCYSSGAGAPDMCEGPGGSPKDPLITRPSAFDRISGDIPVIAGPKKDEPTKEEPKKA